MPRRQLVFAVVPAVLAVALLLVLRPAWLGLGAATERGVRVDERGVREAELELAAGERPLLAGRRDAHHASAPGAPARPWPAALDAVDRLRDLHGVVVTKEGAPVAGAHVTTKTFPWRRGGALTAARYDEGVSGPDARTSDDGSFSLRLVPGQVADLDVRAAGFAAVHLRDRRAGERVRVVMERGIALEVTATLPDGTPAAGARLELAVAGAPRQPLVADEEGRARSKPVPMSRTVTIDVPVQMGYDWDSDDHEIPEREGTHVIAIVVRRAGTITGRVTDEVTGLPVAEATIGVGWMAGVTVTTDGDGRYTLACWPSNGYHDICVAASGYARRDVRVGEREVVDVALARGCEITGRVLGPDGTPCSAAAVVAMGTEHGGTVQRLSLGDDETRKDGTFTLRGLAHDLPHRLMVRADGVGSRNLLVPAIGRVGAVHDLGEIRLARGRTIAGRVLDAGGGPQVGAEVRLVGPAKEDGAVDDRALSDYGKSDETRSDDLGRFHFVDREPGRYVLMAVEKEPVRTARDVDLPADADRVDETLTLPPRRRLRIEPVDDQGKTVFPVYARLRWDGGKRDDGLWDPREFEVLLPGKVRGLTVWLNPMGVDGLVDPGPVALDDDATHVRVVFRRIPVVTGRLLDELGKPLARALVGAWREGAPVGSATTEQDGTFSFGVEGTALIELRFEGRVYGVTESAWFDEVAKSIGAVLRDVRPGATGVELVAHPVPADRALEIRVLDPDGAPAGDLAVSVTPRKEGGSKTQRTNAAGRIALADLPPTHLVIRADIPEERRDFWWSPRLTQVLPAGQVVTLRLVRPRFVEGTIVSSKGTPLSGATVSAELGDEASEQRQADAQGKFRVPLAPEGGATVDLEAFSQDAAGAKWRAEMAGVPIGGGPVRLVAEPHDGIVR